MLPGTDTVPTCLTSTTEDAMKTNKLFVILLLAVLFQPTTPLRAWAEEKEPVDLIFNDILAMYQDLKVSRFFKLEGIPKTYREAITFDPTQAEFFELMNKTYQFTTDELATLTSNGFFARDTGWYGGFGIIYYNIYARDLPVLVTTDSLLHALHKSYDDILMEIEEYHFAPALKEVLQRTRQEVFNQSREPANKALLSSFQDADLYLTVAMSLLDQEQVPSLFESDKSVARILTEIASLRMLVPHQDPPIELYGEKRWVDFSQFKPRGHYTKSNTLEAYFRCLMWMGRADTGMNVLLSTRQLTTAAVLVLSLLEAEELHTLKNMDHIINFMVGRSDNLTVFGLEKLLEELDITRVSKLADAKVLATVAQGIKEGRAGTQTIRSQMVVSWPTDTVKVAPPSLFQLFGQRYIIDSFVLSKVVFDDIIFEGRKQERYMPSPLDVMAAFGNDEALALLKDELSLWNYSANLKAARDFVNSHRPEFWQDNLYNIWLDALRILDRPMADKRAPQAMQTRAWQHKQLNTQLASWAQLRHDTILYAKQSYTSAAGCVYPKGFVEPYPEFYNKLAFFATRAEKLFQQADFIPAEDRQRFVKYFSTMQGIMQKLTTLAEKELAGKSFSGTEEKWLESLISRRDARGYGATPDYSGWYVDLFFSGQETAIDWDPTVADVHTDPNSRQVLEVGVGRVNTLFMAIDNDKDFAMYAGPVFSYYEFHQPAEQRMTDEEWKEMLLNDKAPDRPTWTNSYIP
jgi:hypothetical protein